mmetsp:Transcript_13724/g.37071  ORF Transcript_13724/g.37071 Transcript_13724/m.37071 type:complete len:212 (-) Transcript_13724:693-1328(-)
MPHVWQQRLDSLFVPLHAEPLQRLHRGHSNRVLLDVQSAGSNPHGGDIAGPGNLRQRVEREAAKPCVVQVPTTVLGWVHDTVQRGNRVGVSNFPQVSQRAKCCVPHSLVLVLKAHGCKCDAVRTAFKVKLADEFHRDAPRVGALVARDKAAEFFEHTMLASTAGTTNLPQRRQAHASHRVVGVLQGNEAGLYGQRISQRRDCLKRVRREEP